MGRRLQTQIPTAKAMQPLQAGDRVRVFNTGRQNWQRAGTVLNEVAPRTYAVQTDTGAVVRRNRLQLLKRQASNAVPSIEEHRDKHAQQGTVTDNQPVVLEENAPVMTEPEAAPERQSERIRKAPDRLDL